MTIINYIPYIDIFVTQIKRADICSIHVRSLKEADYEPADRKYHARYTQT